MSLGFTETVLRDANQSLIATRLKRADFEGILEDMDNAGYYSLECWGGATFDSCIRYLNEDPWERLRVIKSRVKKTKLQMLLRGQSLLGYRHYPDDIVRRFVATAIENGIDIIRIFDALNDINNIVVAVEETKKNGAHPSCAIAYTESPVHNLETFVKLASDFVEIGAESVCIKDMSGILSPAKAFDLISALKKSIQVPIVLHSHCTGGLASMSYLKAIEAGVDVLDTAISSFSGGASQPPTEVISNIASSIEGKTSLDKTRLKVINSFFSKVLKKYYSSGVLEYKALMTDPDIIDSQIPGGMYTNLIKQLQDLGCINRLEEVVSRVPEVRRDLGYPPLVTPLSQMVITQTVLNVTTETEYAQVCNEVKAYLVGEYGSPPGIISKRISFQPVDSTLHSSDLCGRNIPCEGEAKEKQVAGLRGEARIGYDSWDRLCQKHENDDYDECDLLTCALFPAIGDEFVANRKSLKSLVCGNELDEFILNAPNVDDSLILKQADASEIEPKYDDFIDFDNDEQDRDMKNITVTAPMPGTIIEIKMSIGDTVSIGETLVVCESMKMESGVVSTVKGIISRIFVSVGERIQIRNKLAEITLC